jgi:hypothetical protein
MLNCYCIHQNKSFNHGHLSLLQHAIVLVVSRHQLHERLRGTKFSCSLAAISRGASTDGSDLIFLCPDGNRHAVRAAESLSSRGMHHELVCHSSKRFKHQLRPLVATGVPLGTSVKIASDQLLCFLLLLLLLLVLLVLFLSLLFLAIFLVLLALFASFVFLREWLDLTLRFAYVSFF